MLIAEERLLRAESSEVNSRASVTRAAVNLYTAMGIVAPESLQPTPPNTGGNDEHE